MRSPLLIAAPLLAIVIFMLAVESASPKLKRSNGKRWDRLSGEPQ